MNTSFCPRPTPRADLGVHHTGGTPPPSPVLASGATYNVATLVDPLSLRSELVIPKVKNANVIARLPDGVRVRAVTGTPVNGFLEVETGLDGALLRGFAATRYLKLVDAHGSPIPVVTPSPTPPTTGIVAVYMPKPAGLVTKPTGHADAHTLNEAKQPGRKSATAEARCNEIAAIVEWLGVDRAAHRRYQPHGTTTYCNLYAHDFAHLAGCYVPRVWWTDGALLKLAAGQEVKPRLGLTIREMRANDLFRWLRDFGPRFGWRRTGTLTKLQTEVNQGAVGIIVARRVIEAASGHIVAVVPETDQHMAVRNAAGEVVAPVQSQAGSKNFRYSTYTVNWFKHARFAEFGFWLHA